MDFYSAYQNKVASNGQTIRDQKIKIKNDFLISTFKDAPEYVQVNKNFDYNTFYDVWIYEGNQKDDVIGHKYLKSYPYDTVQFDIGDYIHWTYGGNQETWIVSTINKQYLFDVNGRIIRCNNYLKWRDSTGKLLSYPCCVDEKVQRSLFEFSNSIIIPKGYVFVTAQSNSDTTKINVNDRFIFGNQPFKIQSVNNFTDTASLLIIFEKDNISPSDDLVNGIADNSNSGLVSSTPTSGDTLW